MTLSRTGAVLAALALLGAGRPAGSQEGGLSVTINVVDHQNGHPVGGVHLRWLELHPPVEGSGLHETRTGPGGQWALSGLRAGTYVLSVVSAPQRYAVEQFPRIELSGNRLIQVRMYRAARVTGEVARSDAALGSPSVQVHQLHDGGYVSRTVEPGPDGRFEFEQLNAEFPAIVTARATGAHGRQAIIQPRGARAEGMAFDQEEGEREPRGGRRGRLRFNLTPYNPAVPSLSGQILLEGAPLQGAGVAVTSRSPIGDFFVSQMAVSDAEGRYDVPDLPPGPYRVLVVNASGVGRPWREMPKPVEILAGQPAVVDFNLAP